MIHLFGPLSIWERAQASTPIVAGGGPRPAGGWYDNTGWESVFLRPVRDERDEQELTEAVAEKVTYGVEVEWVDDLPVFDAPPTINWAAVEQVKALPEGPNQAVLLEALQRVIAAAVRARDEEDIALVMLIH